MLSEGLFGETSCIQCIAGAATFRTELTLASALNVAGIVKASNVRHENWLAFKTFLDVLRRFNNAVHLG